MPNFEVFPEWLRQGPWCLFAQVLDVGSEKPSILYRRSSKMPTRYISTQMMLENLRHIVIFIFHVQQIYLLCFAFWLIFTAPSAWAAQDFQSIQGQHPSLMGILKTLEYFPVSGRTLSAALACYCCGFTAWVLRTIGPYPFASYTMVR